MKILLTIALLLIGSVTFAQEKAEGPTSAQVAKSLGRLKGVPLAEVKTHVMARAFVEEDLFCAFPHEIDPDLAFTPIAELSDALSLTEEQCGVIQELQRSLMYALATGEGSYPAGCLQKYPGVHAIQYWVNEASFPAHMKRPLTDGEIQGIIDSRVWGPTGDPRGPPFAFEQLKAHVDGRPMLDVALEFTEECMRRIGLIMVRVHTGSDGQHNIHIRSLPIPGSTIGIGWFPGADPCPGDHVNQHIDNGYRPNFQQLWGLLLHECGHCVKLPHQFTNQGAHQDPLSYSYRQHPVYGFVTPEMVSIVDLPVSPSVTLLTRYYGGKPVGSPWKGVFGDKPPPLPGTKLELDLQIQMHNGKPIIINEFNVQGRDFIIVPRPSI